MESDRKKLTPRKVIIIYVIAFVLVSVHELDRIVLWLEAACLDWDSAPVVLEVCQSTREMSRRVGLTGLHEAEAKWLGFSRNLPMLGEAGAPRPAGPGAEAGFRTESALKNAEAGVNTPSTSVQTAAAPDPGAPAAPPEPKVSAPVKVASLAVPLKEKLHPKTVLVAGDSMILEGFGPALQRALKKYTGLTVAREGKYSSGLARPDYFNWPQYMVQILDQHKPDLLVITLGANDPQDIVDANRKRHFVASESWNQIYHQRAADLIKIPQERGIDVYWVGLPIMGPDKYNERIKNLNGMAAQACKENPKCTYIDTWWVLANEKKQYTTFVKDEKGRHIRIRAKDNIHLTNDGGDLLVKYFLEQVRNEIVWPAPAVPAEGEGGGEPEKSPPAEGRTPLYNVDGSLKKPATRANILLGGFESKALGRKTSYFAFVPEFEKGGPEKFPVLLLLHGMDQTYSSWKDNAQNEIAAVVQKYGIVVVTPEGGRYGWYTDSPHDPANQYETYMVQELLPHLKDFLPLVDGPAAVCGIDMGGTGAYNLTRDHPDLFASYSAMSGVWDLIGHAGEWELQRIFGALDKASRPGWEERSPLLTVEKSGEFIKGKPFLFDCGESDEQVLEENRAMAEKVKALGKADAYQETTGGHDWEYWKDRLARHAAFHAAILSGVDAKSPEKEGISTAGAGGDGPGDGKGNPKE